MKQSLLISLTIALSLPLLMSETAFAETPCTITLKVSKASSKSAKLKGVSFSTKQIMALRSVCDIKLAHMTKADKIEAYKAKLELEEADIKAFMEAN